MKLRYTTRRKYRNLDYLDCGGEREAQYRRKQNAMALGKASPKFGAKADLVVVES